jgi:NADH-quinone oxidoreductase subunit N
LIGIGYKLSFAPLHFWSPDVYEGAPTPVTAFLSTAPKIAGFAVLIRFLSGFQTLRLGSFAYPVFDYNLVLSVIAIATMIIGNFSALWQNNVKRMLAYSSIGHTGFLLMAIIAYSPTGFKSLLFYLSVYAVMNMLAFFLADKIEEKTGAVNLSEYTGLGKILKVELVCFVIVLIALTGLPPTAGFIAKFLVFSSVLQVYAGSKSLLILMVMITGALSTVVSLFYYFKVPLNAFLREGGNKVQPENTSFLILPVILTVLLIFLGIFPEYLTNCFSR